MEIVVKKLENATAREIARKGKKPRKQQYLTADGKRAEQWVIDLASDTDLTYVFGANVAKARRENKRLFGSADGPVVC